MQFYQHIKPLTFLRLYGIVRTIILLLRPPLSRFALDCTLRLPAGARRMRDLFNTTGSLNFRLRFRARALWTLPHRHEPRPSQIPPLRGGVRPLGGAEGGTYPHNLGDDGKLYRPRLCGRSRGFGAYRRMQGGFTAAGDWDRMFIIQHSGALRPCRPLWRKEGI